ncbi:MAG: LysR family transcriptional regulator [Kofleriaceae bacterium]|nr:LysR family transcriptional regulator [Kofleriaceae bacterium]
MDLRQLRYFQAVAAAGSLSTAARRLGVSQPALSVALRKLEAAVGAPLLARDQRGAALTTAGRSLLGAVDQALAVLADGQRAAVAAAQAPGGRLVLACAATVAPALSPVVVGALLAALPTLRPEVLPLPSTEVEQAVQSRAADLGLVTHVARSRELVRALVVDDELVVVGPSAPSWAEAGAMVRAGPLWLDGSLPAAASLQAELGRRGLPCARIVEAGALGVVASAVAGGAGLGLYPRRLGQLGPHPLTPLHARLPSTPMQVHLLVRAERRRASADQRAIIVAALAAALR